MMIVCIWSVWFSFAQVDTLCNGGWSQVDAWIVLTDSSGTRFVKCYEWYVVQPVGGDIEYDTTNPNTPAIDYDQGTETAENAVNWLRYIWESNEYGSVYVDWNIMTAQSISVEKDTTTMLYISWALIALLVIWWLFTLARKEQE